MRSTASWPACPEEVMFATKPQLAGDLLEPRARACGIRAAFVTGDEVYGGRAAAPRASASAGWAMCWRSAPTTPSPPARAAP